MSSSSIDWVAIEAAVRRDPATRGPAAYRHAGQLLGAGSWEAAARNLAADGRRAAIVTGFCIPGADPPAAETDGPPGALFLARALAAVGIEAWLITDAYGLPLLEVGCDAWSLPRDHLLEFPFDAPELHHGARSSNADEHCALTDAWIDAFQKSSAGRELTHLIAVERVGPSHTVDSMALQRRSGPPPLTLFEQEMPLAERNVCHDMRGAAVGAWTAKTHRLFEALSTSREPLTTIGILDGGNEIGAGAIPWEVWREAIAAGNGGRVACRIATNHALVAGISNWAAYALALAVCALKGRPELAAPWDAESQGELIELLVQKAGAVDGVTRLREATVDGLPLSQYLDVLTDIRRAVGAGC